MGQKNSESLYVRVIRPCKGKGMRAYMPHCNVIEFPHTKITSAGERRQHFFVCVCSVYGYRLILPRRNEKSKFNSLQQLMEFDGSRKNKGRRRIRKKSVLAAKHNIG